MAHRRFWDSMGPPGLLADRDLRPKGGLTSSELLTACRPDMDTVELIWGGRRTTEKRRDGVGEGSEKKHTEAERKVTGEERAREGEKKRCRQ